MAYRHDQLSNLGRRPENGHDLASLFKWLSACGLTQLFWAFDTAKADAFVAQKQAEEKAAHRAAQLQQGKLI